MPLHSRVLHTARHLVHEETYPIFFDGQWKQRISEIGTKSCPESFDDEIESRPAEPGQEELVDYVVVGVIPLTLPEGLESARGRRGAVGTSLPTTALTPEIKPAMRAVAEKMDELPLGGAKYYVLTDVDHESKHCNAHLTSADQIFFFPEYRTTTTIFPKELQNGRPR